MRVVVILFIGPLIFLGCRPKDSRPAESQTDSLFADKKKSDAPLSPEISLDSFAEIPNESEGCSCSFSESEEQYQRNEYLFVCGFDSTAFVSVDGVLLKLKLVTTGRDPNTFGNYDHVDVFKNEDYTVTLDIRYKEGGDEEDEGWWNNGTITVEDESGQSIKLTFFGSCGC